MDSDELKAKAEELFKTIIQMETDKYDYEQRKLTQELDLKELKERQKAQLRAKALKKGLDPRLLLASTLPRSACTPSMRGEPIPGLTMTERSSTKEAGRLSEPNTSSLPGRRSTMNGARDPPRSCPSGSARGPARRREPPRLPRARRRPRPPPPRRRITMRRKRRRRTMRRRNKQQLKFNTNQVQVLTSSSRMICLVPTSTFPIWTGFEDFHHPHSCCHVSHQPPRRL